MTTPDLTGIGDPVYARVRERIRQDILSGYFQPGARIKTSVLGARYSVSQMPIREALQQLQGEGLVMIAPNKGASVRRVDASFVNNLYDIRAALEGLLTRRAVGAVTDEDMFTLYAIEGRFEDAAQRHDAEAVVIANRELHETMYALARNPEAVEVISRHSGLLQSLRRQYGYGTGRMEQIIAEHRQLLRAFDQRDAATAVRVTEEHCEHAKRDLIAQAGFTTTEAEPKRSASTESHSL
ncbi:MAG: GntR family transcriptional regulator [Bryobacteraceae bacterium]